MITYYDINLFMPTCCVLPCSRTFCQWLQWMPLKLLGHSMVLSGYSVASSWHHTEGPEHLQTIAIKCTNILTRMPFGWFINLMQVSRIPFKLVKVSTCNIISLKIQQSLQVSIEIGLTWRDVNLWHASPFKQITQSICRKPFWCWTPTIHMCLWCTVASTHRWLLWIWLLCGMCLTSRRQ